MSTTENSVEDPVEKQIMEDLKKPEMKKRVDKERRKGEKMLELFMKSIADLSAEEKTSALCKKNRDFLEDIRNCKGSIQLLQRRVAVLDREKELLQNEQSKAVLARSRLEALCRELQKQNKSIKDESMQKIREEEEKRKEVSLRFQSSLNEVTQNVQQNADKNVKLREDNIEMATKFHQLCEQFKQREEEVIRLTKQMNLEKQLAEATVKRSECQLNAEREIWNKEKEFHRSQMKANEVERVKLEQSLQSLKDQLAIYSTKYQDFESTISKSNQVFGSYKTEMKIMSKQINKLEKECGAWKDRWQQAQLKYNHVIDGNKTLEKEMAHRDKKLDKLADLCRSIQEERAAYLKQLKDNGLTPVTLPEKPITAPPATEPVAAATNKKQKKPTKKEEKLVQLKSEMELLKTQLNETETSGQAELDCCSAASADGAPALQNESDANNANEDQVQCRNGVAAETASPVATETFQPAVPTTNEANGVEQAKDTLTKSEDKSAAVNKESKLKQNSNKKVK